MNSLHTSFEDTRSIKVLVIPIGENSLFDTHFDIVSKLKCLPIYELNRPSNWKTTGQIFKHFNWNNPGNASLTFDYLRYDRVPNGPGDLDNFQCTRRVLMVIGLINYPELGRSIDKIEEELDYFSRRHPYVVLRRIFVFNYTFDQISPPLPTRLKGPSDDINSLVVLAPDGECEGGNMVEVHLHEVMGYAAIKIFSALEKQTSIIDDCLARNKFPTTLKLSTFHDEVDDGHDKDSKARRIALIHKKPSGRMHKWKGDFSLQVCSPIDALEHYIISIAECRALGDGLWLAGALEGYLITILVLLSLGISMEDYIGKDVRTLLSKISSEPVPQNTNVCTMANIFSLAEDRAKEALSIYSKSIHFSGLEVECSLRLARMFEADMTIGRDQKVLDYVFHAAAVPGLNIQHQIECTVEGALICSRLGMKRKYGFLLYLAALMCVESDNISSAHALIRNSCSQYGLNSCALSALKRQGSLSIHDSLEAQNLATENDIEMIDPSASWISMRKALFAHSAYIAKECGDTLSASRFTAALLRLTRDSGKRTQSMMKHYEEELLEYYEPVEYFTDSVAVDSGKGKRINLQEMTPDQHEEFFIRNTISVRRSSFSSVASSAASVFHPPSITILNQKLVESQQQKSNTFASLITSTSDSFMFSLRNSSDDSIGGFGDITVAANKLKEGFKKIAVPKAPSFLKALRKSEQRLLRLRKAKSAEVYTTVEYATPLNSPLPAGTRISDVSRYSDAVITEEIDALDRTLSLQQEQAIAMLEKWTSELPPASLLHLPVTLLQIKLQQFPEGKRPFKLLDATVKLQDKLLKKNKAIANRITQLEHGNLHEDEQPSSLIEAITETPGKSPALFYDPFAAKREKELSSANVEVLWVKDVICTCTAFLENPLDVDIKLDSVRLLLNGVRHTSFARTINIPARARNYPVELTVKPHEVGSLKVVGIEISLNNAIDKLLVDEAGMCVPNKPEIAAAYEYPFKAFGYKKMMKAANNDSNNKSKNLVESSNSTIVAHSPHINLAHLWQTKTQASDAISIEICEGEVRTFAIVAMKQNTEVVSGRCNSIEDIRIIVNEYINDSKKTYTIREFSSSVFRNETESIPSNASLRFKESNSIVDALNSNDTLELEFEMSYVQDLKKYSINFEIIPKDAAIKSITDDISGKSIEELRSITLVSSPVCCRTVSFDVTVVATSGVTMNSTHNVNNEAIHHRSDISVLCSRLGTTSYCLSKDAHDIKHEITFIAAPNQAIVRLNNSVGSDVIIAPKHQTSNLIKNDFLTLSKTLNSSYFLVESAAEDAFPLLLPANSTRTIIIKSSDDTTFRLFEDKNLHWTNSNGETRYGKVIINKLSTQNQIIENYNDINDSINISNSHLSKYGRLNISLKGFEKQNGQLLQASAETYYDISANIKLSINSNDINKLKHEQQKIEVAVVVLLKDNDSMCDDNSVLFTGKICSLHQQHFIDEDDTLSLSISHNFGIYFTQPNNYYFYILLHDKTSNTEDKKIWFTTLPFCINCN